MVGDSEADFWFARHLAIAAIDSHKPTAYYCAHRTPYEISVLDFPPAIRMAALNVPDVSLGGSFFKRLPIVLFAEVFAGRAAIRAARARTRDFCDRRSVESQELARGGR